METRRQFEQQILQHYHTQILANGVQDYSWARLFVGKIIRGQDYLLIIDCPP